MQAMEVPVELLDVQQELSEALLELLTLLVAGTCGAVGGTARVARSTGRTVGQ